MNTINKSIVTFSNNLYLIMNYYNLTSYKMLSDFLNQKEPTVKNWIRKHRAPKLTTLDEIASELEIESYRLIKPNVQKKDFMNYQGENNSTLTFQVKFQAILIDKYKKRLSPDEISAKLHGLISTDTIISYMRKRNGIAPTLGRLDAIANILGVPTFELIKPIKEEN